MGKDYETFDKISKGIIKKKVKHDELLNIFADLFGSINYKVAIFLFIIGIIIFSDTFIDSFLNHIPGSVYDDSPTTKGTVVQLVVLVFGYILIDLLVQGEVL